MIIDLFCINSFFSKAYFIGWIENDVHFRNIIQVAYNYQWIIIVIFFSLGKFILSHSYATISSPQYLYFGKEKMFLNLNLKVITVAEYSCIFQNAIFKRIEFIVIVHKK